MDDIFKIVKQLRKDNQDVVGEKCVKDDSGNLSFDNEAKKVAWKQHYERLLNEEFSWNPEDLTADPVVGPPIHIDVEMVVIYRHPRYDEWLSTVHGQYSTEN